MKKISLLGNLGKDAVINQTGDYCALQFTIATTERQKDASGWNDFTTWSNVTYWGKKEMLEKLLAHLKKGKKVFVDGKFTITIYNDKPQIQMTAETLVLC